MYKTEDNPELHSEERPEQQYERHAASTTPYVVLSALIAVVSLIAVLAAWTSA